MKKRTVVILIVSVLGLFLVFRIGKFLLNTLMFSQQGMNGFGHHGGPRGFHHALPGNSVIGHTFAATGWFLPLVAQLALMVIGFVIWKTAKNNRLKKWLGIALLAIGMILLLPKIILIPLAVIIAYMAYKSKSSDSELSFSYDINGQAVTSNSDYLDQWEKKTKTEE